MFDSKPSSFDAANEENKYQQALLNCYQQNLDLICFSQQIFLQGLSLQSIFVQFELVWNVKVPIVVTQGEKYVY